MNSGALRRAGQPHAYIGATRAHRRLLTQHRAGEVVALLGPSGCGKTTALRVLAASNGPMPAECFVDARRGARAAQKRDMGMVFQSYSLFPNMTGP